MAADHRALHITDDDKAMVFDNGKMYPVALKHIATKHNPQSPWVSGQVLCFNDCDELIHIVDVFGMDVAIAGDKCWIPYDELRKTVGVMECKLVQKVDPDVVEE